MPRLMTWRPGICCGGCLMGRCTGPSSVARSLRLAAGELVATVTVSFEDPVAHRPVAITTAMLRPDLFRIVIQAGAGPDGRTDGFASAWTHAATGWEP
jgi:hypothetical protein